MITREDAEAKVSADRRPGTFLFRFSSSEPGAFTITTLAGSSIKNYRIAHRPGFGYACSQLSSQPSRS